MTKTLLDIKNLSVIYKTDNAVIKAVNGIDFSIGKQQTIGLVGETGAGKTTTARAVMQLLPERTGRVTSGEIIYCGENLLQKTKQEMRAIRGAKISMIFQDPMTSLNPIMTIGEQILESLEIHNMHLTKTERNARVDELLSLVGIKPGRKHAYPHQFSGGMKQRVVIAIALACEPELLIADEPTTALDVTIQAQVLALMEGLKTKLGTSLIMITHDLGVVAETCDKVAIMYAGEIIENGLVQDIFESEKPHHPYTVGLFNSIPDIESSSERLIPIEGLMADPTDLPAGCKFHPRCKSCQDRCRAVAPSLYESGEHQIRCHLFA